MTGGVPLKNDRGGVSTGEDLPGHIETHGVDYIPDELRHSKPANVFWILIGANLTFGQIILGWLPVSLGLSWWASFWAILLGTAVGALMLAPMALIGPRVGTNGPVSSGAFFGVVGRMIGSVIGLFTALGFYALTVWTGGQIAVYGAHRLFHMADGNLQLGIAYAIIALIAIAVAVFGHANLVIVQKAMIPTAGTLMVIGFFVFGGRFHAGYAGGHLLLGNFAGTFMLSVTTAAAATFGYAPFINDWTRHISHRRYSDHSVVAATSISAFVGVAFPMLFGAYTSVALGHLAATDYVSGLVGGSPLGYLIPLALLGIIGSLGQASICMYSTGLDTSSIIPVFTRVVATLVLSGIGLLFIYLGTFVWNAENAISGFVSLLGVLIAPWLAVVVTGHFLRRGWYDPDDLQVFNRRQRGGIYWFWNGLNWRGCVAWALAGALGLLFLNSTLYVGPFANVAGGVDLSWLSATVLGALLYLGFNLLAPEPRAVYGPHAAVGAGTRLAVAEADTPLS